VIVGLISTFVGLYIFFNKKIKISVVSRKNFIFVQKAVKSIRNHSLMIVGLIITFVGSVFALKTKNNLFY